MYNVCTAHGATITFQEGGPPSHMGASILIYIKESNTRRINLIDLRKPEVKLG